MKKRAVPWRRWLGWRVGVPAGPMGSLRLFLTIALLVLPGGAWAATGAPKLEVQVYQGGFASVNSFIFSNGQSLAVLDVQRTAAEARRLADLVKARHLPLTYILISHGHTDHFTGMALFHSVFPRARIVVCSNAIKQDIKAYAIYMNSGGATGAEPALDPALRPKSAENPTGFDYEGTIHVLAGKSLSLPGGGTLDLTCDYPPTEAPHMTTVYSRDLNALFVADLGYNKVHPWMGDDVSNGRIATWRGELEKLKVKYRALNPRVYPGHGAPTDMRLFERMIRYFGNFERITSESSSRAAAMREMEALYPGYKEANFFLKYSVENHVR